jgi:hypothetical protein
MDFCSAAFSKSQVRLLRNALDKGFNTAPDAAARLLAEQIHVEFTTNPTVDSQTFEQLISVFRMLNAKDVFEAAHHILLSKRILMQKRHIVRADETFLAALTKQSGPDYVKRLGVLLNDLHNSTQILRSFQLRKGVPPGFSAIVVAKSAWPATEPSQGMPPPSIRQATNAYSDFYRTKFAARTLQWSLAFSRAKLAGAHGVAIREIRCGGTLAVVFLALAQMPLTAEEIASRTGLTPGQVAALAKPLLSRGCGRVLFLMRGKYAINVDAVVPDGILNIPVAFPVVPAAEDERRKSAIDSNREWQIAAAIMVVMKRERSLEKGNLRQTVRSLLQFRMEDALFENRLAHLAQNLYVKLDTTGRVHYLP